MSPPSPRRGAGPTTVDASPRVQWLKNQLYALLFLTYYGFVQQYSRAALGLLWFFITPLSLMAIYGALLQGVYDVRLPGAGSKASYAQLILAGLLPWSAFADAVGNGAYSLINNPSVLRHSPMPPIFLPTVKVIQPFLGLAVGMAVLVAAGALLGDLAGARVLLVLVSCACLFLFALGVTWIVAALAAYLRDVTQLVSTLLLIGMFASPVFYTPSMIQGMPEVVQVAMRANPLSAYIGLSRAAFISNPFDPLDVVLGVLFALVALALGAVVFRRLEPGLADCV